MCEEGAGPVKVGVALTDILTGLYATVGVLAALRTSRTQRRRPTYRHGAARRAGRLPRQPGAQLPHHRRGAQAHGQCPSEHRAPSGFPLPTATSFSPSATTVSSASSARWPGVPSGRPMPRFATNRARCPSRRTDSADPPGHGVPHHGQWVSALEQAGVPCGADQRPGAGVRRPAGAASRLNVEMPHPLAGRVRRWPARCGCPLRQWRTATRRHCLAKTARRCCSACWA